jgi:aspartyl-tRNA(Asn)/glutamyl-tRNA(Gln) amidotransferase subunit A
MHWLDAADLHRLYVSGALRPSDLLVHLVDRIARWNPVLHAFIVPPGEEAFAAARQSDARYAAGRPLGPLDGVPVGVKDVIDVAGLPTTCHSHSRLGHIAAADAACVADLRRVGAVIAGKLATHEFAIGGPAFDLPFPPARNPWNTAHHPGGSSSGSGSAVSAGLLPLALGTDTAGSVRNPASACGIVGLKPAYGAIDVEGVVPLAKTLDHVGVLARSVRDVFTALQQFGGLSRRLSVEADEPPRLDGMKIGFVRHFHNRDMPADAEVAAGLDAAAAQLAQVGATVLDVELPPLQHFSVVNRIILQAEGFAEHGQAILAAPELFSALTRKALLPGAFLSAQDLLRALEWKAALTAQVDEALRTNDVLLCASSMVPPCRIDDPATIEATYMQQARGPFNVTGHPALAMRSGLSAGGLPLSVQFVAGKGGEDHLYRAAAAWERLGGAFTPPPLMEPCA